MATYRDQRDRDHLERERSGRGSWPDDDTRAMRGRSDDDDYTRQLSERYGQGQGGYDRGAYRQGGYGESGFDQGSFEQGASRSTGRGRESDRDFSPRHSFRDRGYGEGGPGDEHFTTGAFGGGTDQGFRSGGQYQGESGYGARPGYGGDFSGGGYLGRGTGSRPQRDVRSGGAFGEDPRGWYGPEGSSRSQGDEDRSRAFAQPRGGGFRGRGPKNYTRSDQRITEDLCERLTDDDDIDAGGIDVQVSQGTVTLTGTVAERWMKHRAEDLAERCGGVRDVENRIRVSREGDEEAGNREASATPGSGSEAGSGASASGRGSARAGARNS